MRAETHSFLCLFTSIFLPGISKVDREKLFVKLTMESPENMICGVSRLFLLFSGFDTLADYLWDNNNKGKLWKDIKHKYEVVEE
jgi:hypothetical protein